MTNIGLFRANVHLILEPNSPSTRDLVIVMSGNNCPQTCFRKVSCGFPPNQAITYDALSIGKQSAKGFQVPSDEIQCRFKLSIHLWFPGRLRIFLSSFHAFMVARVETWDLKWHADGAVVDWLEHWYLLCKPRVNANGPTHVKSSFRSPLSHKFWQAHVEEVWVALVVSLTLSSSKLSMYNLIDSKFFEKHDYVFFPRIVIFYTSRLFKR